MKLSLNKRTLFWSYLVLFFTINSNGQEFFYPSFLKTDTSNPIKDSILAKTLKPSIVSNSTIGTNVSIVNKNLLPPLCSGISGNQLVNPSFEVPAQSNIGNNFLTWPISGWNGSGAIPNIVKTNGIQSTGGPTNASDGVQYLDIVGSSADFYQQFVFSCNSEVFFSGYFSVRDNLSSTGRIDLLRVNSNNTSTIVASSNQLNMPPTANIWYLASGSAVIPPGTYRFNISMGNNSNFDNACFSFNNPVVSAGSYGPLCENSNIITLTGIPTDSSGVWSGNGVVDNGNGTASFNPSGLGGNNVTVTYANYNSLGFGCTQSTNITVNPSIIPTFTQVNPICSGATLTALPTTSNNSITGTWSPALNNTATTTYTFTPTTGVCATTATMTITVNPKTTPTFTQVQPICSGATLAALPTTSNNGITGTWSPALNNTSTTTYSFTPTTGLCANSATMTITVNPNVTPLFTQVTPICSGTTLTVLPTTSNNSITGTWSPAINNTATTTYTFTPTTGVCATSKTMTITVNPKTAPTFTQVTPKCFGATLAALPTTSNNAITGTWSPLLNNNATTTYTFTPTTGVCATTATMTITVNPNVTPTFTQVNPICSGGTLAALPTTSTNGIIGNWSPALNNTATTTYTFTPTTGVCASTATMTIVVDTPSILNITNNNPNCNPNQLSWSNVNTINSSTAIASIGSNTITINNPSGGLFSTSNVFNGSIFPSQYNLPINNLTLANNLAGLFTFCFNTPVTNPQIAIASIGNSGLPVSINTSVPYQVIWAGPGMNFINNQSLVGREGYCIIVFPGTHQCISFDYLTSEYYCNIVFGTQDNNCQIEPLCLGNSVELVPHGATNVTWSPTNNLTFLPNSNNVIATPSQTTTYTATTNNSCQNQASITVTVNPNITPTFTQVSPICSGATVAALPTTSNNGITGTWSPAINNTATTTYTFTPTTGLCATTATMTITVNPKTTPIFTPVNPVCSGATLAALPTTSNNGIIGTWSPAVNNTATTMYTFTPTTGLCATTATTNVVITPLPTATITYAGSPFCSSLSTAQVITLTGTGAYTGGNYSSTAGLTINPTTGAITPSTSTPGSYVITYTTLASSGCPSVPVTTNVEITPIPTATINYTGSPFCSTLATAQAVTLTGTAAFTGGTYSSTIGLTINPTTGAITPSTSTPGNYVVTYSTLASSGCSSVTATTNVVITPLPTATINYIGSPFCSTLATAQAVTLTGTGAYTGGNYSSTTGLTINPTTGAITPSTSTPGSYVVTYTTLASGGCSSVLVTTNVVITRIPTATISYSGSPFCSTLATAQGVTLTGTAAFTGGTYSSTIGLTINPTTGAITPSTSTPGNYVVTYSTLASSGCSSVTATTNVVITPLPTATINYIGSPFCSTLATAQAVTLTGTGAYTGGAYSSSIGLSINPTSGAITPSTSTPGSYVISYTIATAGGCSPVVTTTPIVINPIPVATATASANTICTLSSTNIVLTSDIVGTTYNWTVIQTNATGATNGSGASINQILTNSSFTSGTVDYQISPTANGCSGNVIQSTITVNPKPDVIANPSTQNICTGQPTSINLSGNVTGTTYNWTVSQVDVLGASPGSGNSIAQILNTNSTNFGIANYTIIPTANSCIGNPIVVPINITPKPVIVATPPLQTICSGDTIVPINLSSSITGTTYNWSVSQTNVLGAINGSGSSIIQTLMNNTTIQRQALYTINSILNNCPGNSITAIVNVNPTPLVNSNTINQTICSNENTNISLTSTVSNTLFSWTVTQNNVTGALPGSGNNINQTLTNNTTITGLATYNVIPVAASCSGLPLLISVNVKPKPNLTSALNATICSMQTTNISLTSNIVGSTFTWTASTTGPLGFSNGQGNTIAQQLQNNANYYGTVTYDVTPTFNGCSNVPSSVKVKVNPLPKPNLVDGTICKDALGNTIRNYILDTGLSNINHSFNWNFNGTPIPNYFQNPYMATQIGVYSVFATNTSTGCRSNPVVTASITEVNPAIKLFAYVGNNLSGNSDITVIVQSGTGPFQYQLDNGIFQNSNVFTSVSPGQHTITVIDNYNCTNLITKTTVLDYPNYFTPNGDNYNDNWNIYGIQDQPFAKIYIYDRFGKLITQINPSGVGWDGNYNGSPLAATDYWFVVEYMEKDSNGITVWKTYKSHFSLIR